MHTLKISAQYMRENIIPHVKKHLRYKIEAFGAWIGMRTARRLNQHNAVYLCIHNQ